MAQLKVLICNFATHRLTYATLIVTKYTQLSDRQLRVHAFRASGKERTENSLLLTCLRNRSWVKMSSPQFELYVKADSSGKAIGDCPFSLRTVIYSHIKVEDWSSVFKVIPIDFQNKSPEFLKLNPAGTTPVLVNKENGETISDSGEITKYINDRFPAVDTQHGYEGPAVEATAGIFGKLVSLLKNRDPLQTAQLKEALTTELRKLEVYLASPEHKGKYLLGDKLSELDCSLLPKLKHLLVAGSHYRNYSIPEDMVNVHQYLKNAMECTSFQAVCPPDAEFVHGWKRHGITPDSK